MAEKLKLFIFDVGGVLCDGTSVVLPIAGHLGLSEREFLTLAQKAGLRELQIGKISAKDFWKNFSKFFGRTIERDLWAEFFKPVLKPDTVRLIEELKTKYRVVAGTNTIESHYLIHSQQGHYDVFDRVYASHQIGLMKPQKEFFLYILESESAKPEETFFVDDTIENVAAAREINIRSLLFTSAEKLKQELASLGID
ncbi:MULTISPECIES: HAD family hydrolase [Pseudothermotoga]|uniref:HAD family hydrolase n=1 Tax=Pseudothermotoga TaxID=1643951 RepID=UPI00042A46D1|nr:MULTISPECIES: HAD family phosphatase [Pseudothermotoga]MDI6862766.1 HAD family phosphatase [Pseudothermotoga sp.]